MKNIKKLINFLNLKEKIFLSAIILLGIVISILELISFASFVPLTEVIINKEGGDRIRQMEYIKYYFPFETFNNEKIIIFFLIIFTVLLLVTNFLNLFFVWTSYFFCNYLAATKSKKLLENYLNLPYIFHLKSSKSDLTGKVLIKIQIIGDKIYFNIIFLFQKISLLIIYIATLLIVNWKITLIFILMILLFYLFLNVFTKSKVSNFGKKFSETIKKRMIILDNSLGGITDVKIFNRSNYFKEQFFRQAKDAARFQAFNKSISISPKYFLEILIVLFVLMLFIFYIEDTYVTIQNNIGLIAFVIVCSLRILPAFQGIFVSITEIHTHITLFEEVYEDYNEKIKINKLTYLNDKNFNENSSNIKFDKKIFLKDVSLKIDDRIILDKINLELQTNKLVAIIGKSGSGKTSILNIIAGLLEPTTGKVVYDKNEVNYLTRLNNSSLVSQFTFLYEDTLLNNIIFDKTDPLKDKELLEKNIQLSGLETLYNKIGRRPDYLIKDSGKNFSGGEKQRIGLARAFSKDTNILLLDEFTSSLDEKKEIDIFQKILNIKKKKLIIFSSHKINLIKLADSVIGIKNGKIEFISNPQLDDQLNNKISDLYK